MQVSDYTDLLRRMVAIPSLSFEEDKVRDLISSQLREWGLEHRVMRNNIVALQKCFDPSKKTLALDAHIDTVPANQEYSFDPHDAGNDPEVVRGLGSNDDGGSVVSMIATFRHFYDKELPFNLMLVLTCEEERSGMNGARWLYGENGPFKDASCDLPDPTWVIVGEPTKMKAATSERGLLVLDCEAHGVAGHAGRGEGVNALYKAMDDIALLRDHVFEKVSPVMGAVRMTVTQVNAGTVHNVVPDSCKFVVDIRPTEMYTNEEIVDELQTLIQSSITPRNLLNRSSASRPDSPLVSHLEELGIETFSSPTTSDWMRIGCDAIKMGPGDSARSHRKDEFVLTSEIADAIETYIRFIESYGNTLE
ncbi:MAG: M20/M25/M40 family metallo-hydrolase [Bacteroidales bacterium]|nr:M20/M25/M40 family metallo-hydrolase [Candidatus Cryptobacteroides caccocaballi]